MAVDPLLSVLHGLRLRSVADPEDLATRQGLDSRVVRSQLEIAARAGWCRHHDGALRGWSLTVDGRTHGESLLADELDRSGARPAVESFYESFSELNVDLLRVCTEWQVVVRDGVRSANDHLDPDHDGAAIAALTELHGRALPVTDGLARTLRRFEGYSPRLDSAHEQVVSGSTEWFTRAGIDSYHTIWFELHEDLLATLGRQRRDDASTDTPGRLDLGRSA